LAECFFCAGCSGTSRHVSKSLAVGAFDTSLAITQRYADCERMRIRLRIQIHQNIPTAGAIRITTPSAAARRVSRFKCTVERVKQLISILLNITVQKCHVLWRKPTKYKTADACGRSCRCRNNSDSDGCSRGEICQSSDNYFLQLIPETQLPHFSTPS